MFITAALDMLLLITPTPILHTDLTPECRMENDNFQEVGESLSSLIMTSFQNCNRSHSSVLLSISQKGRQQRKSKVS